MPLPERKDDGTWKRALTPEQEREIVARYRAGEMMTPIGRDYGVSRATVRRTLKRHDESPSEIRWKRHRRRRTCPVCGRMDYVRKSEWRRHCSKTCASRGTQPRAHPKRVTDEDLKVDLVWIALDTGRVPRTGDLVRRSRFSIGTFRRDGQGVRQWLRRVDLHGAAGSPPGPEWREWALEWLQERGLMTDYPNGRQSGCRDN